MALVRPGRSRLPGATADVSARARRSALWVFAVMVTAGPLAFGAVDRLTQIALLSLLAVGVALRPPGLERPGKWVNVLLITLIVLFVLKEFAPAAWFPLSAWRTTLTQSYDLRLPWTHNPEPARAFDSLLALAAALVWFVWVRTLAADRENRLFIIWSLFLAGAIVAVISFATQGIDSEAIYGMRYSRGWRGFGPFPNRNHTACLLAMSAILGAGCATWAGSRARHATMVAAISLVGVILAALLATHSRGGLVALGCGAFAYTAMVLAKLRSSRAVSIAVASLLVLGALGFAFGSQVIERFTSVQGGQVSTMTRVSVWRDALTMWKDAPILGHGVASFTQLFPMYQTIELDNQVVLHPESSWLQWLVEMGAVPVLLAAMVFGGVLAACLAEGFRSRRSFYFQAAATAAVLTLVAHSLIDVPGHRWGTAGFALAALAFACPLRSRADALPSSRKAALVPFGIAAFWMLPLIADVPSWSPFSLARLLAREASTGKTTMREMETAVTHFPLSPALHQAIGLRQVWADGRRSTQWAERFRIAARLQPGSWTLPAEQAYAARHVSAGHALHYWQMAIERGGHRREELLQTAVEETLKLPGADAVWSSYVEAHPDLLLAYARTAPEELGQEAFARWWQLRGQGKEPLTAREIEDFYALLPRWGTPVQLDHWMEKHPERKVQDAKAWAAFLHAREEDARAWSLLQSIFPEPPFPLRLPQTPREQIEVRWNTDPGDFVNARVLAHLLAQSGDLPGSAKIILTVAQKPEAPVWFVHKAAHLLGKEGRMGEAVSLMLR